MDGGGGERRRRLFGHINGLVIAPLAQALGERGVLETIAAERRVSLGDLSGRPAAPVLAGVIDVGQPEDLARALRAGHGVDLGDLLNVRTFLDHNRPWIAPAAPRAGSSTGVFADRGRRLAPGAVEESLREHLARWAPWVGRHGLLLAELHTLEPAVPAAHPDETLAPAYDATHGLSDQYILELPVFERVAAEAGLPPDAASRRRFPESPLATVSVQRLAG